MTTKPFAIFSFLVGVAIFILGIINNGSLKFSSFPTFAFLIILVWCYALILEDEISSLKKKVSTLKEKR